MSLPILTVGIRYEQDVVAARQRARQVAGRLGYETQDQTRIATAVSEIARNVLNYTPGGKVEFAVEGNSAPQVLLIRVSDEGQGIAHLDDVLAERYHSPTGMGLGIVGARRLMDQFHIETGPTGTTVCMRKLFARGAPLLAADDLRRMADALMQSRRQDPLEEVHWQNQELLRTLDELRRRHEELLQLNQELEDTNRGVVALYAELDERADYLRRADEVKTRFLSNMSHEFRTPLNSILALSRLLLDGTDGALNEEQQKQVRYIRKGAEDLRQLVDDLLDLAKVEAGKIEVRPVEFEVANLFGALRGMLRPLLINESVDLIFEEPEGLPRLYGDEAKVSQILRNFISNALKFTERGEVRVSSQLAPDEQSLTFAVADTGIGIAPEDQERIFQEFGQVDGPLQKRVKGTGLGLPLSRKLAELLGGGLALQSEPGRGSTFALTVPVVYREFVSAEVIAMEPPPDDPRAPLLVVEDAVEDLLVFEKYLKGSEYRLVPARTLREARQRLGQCRPAAIVLDILLRGEDSWGLLAELKKNEATRDIPVLLATNVDDQHKATALGADAYVAKPVRRQWLLSELARLTGAARRRRVLVIDDDAAARYVVGKLLRASNCNAVEAASGADGLARARAWRPDAIVLDLLIPDMSGFEVLSRLRADPATSAIAVVVLTSKALEPDEQAQLSAQGATVLFKPITGQPDAVAILNAALWPVVGDQERR